LFATASRTARRGLKLWSPQAMGHWPEGNVPPENCRWTIRWFGSGGALPSGYFSACPLTRTANGIASGPSSDDRRAVGPAAQRNRVGWGIAPPEFARIEGGATPQPTISARTANGIAMDLVKRFNRRAVGGAAKRSLFVRSASRRIQRTPVGWTVFQSVRDVFK
jgi:hypothetical protein